MRVINQNYYEVCVMVQYQWLWRADGRDHAADAGVVVGGLVVRQTVLQTEDQSTNPLCQQIFSLWKCPYRKSQLGGKKK